MPNTLLGVEDAEVQAIEKSEQATILHFRLRRRAHTCPRCQAQTDLVHDYWIQQAKDLPLRFKPLVWRYEKRRCRCLACGKRFPESLELLPRCHRHTSPIPPAYPCLYPLTRPGADSQKGLAAA